MTDVEMKEAATGSAKGKAVAKGSDNADKKKFEVKKWNAVALWAWDIVVDNCAICRNHIMDLCTLKLPSKALISYKLTDR
jgi:RING-box protein 1